MKILAAFAACAALLMLIVVISARSGDWPGITGPAGGDLSGLYPNPTVAQASGGLNVGPFSTGSGSPPGAGNVVIDGFLFCNNANNTSVDCLRANNGLATSSLISITSTNGFQFGSSTGPGIAFASSVSVNFTAATTNLITGTPSGLTINNGFGGALKLTNGSLLSMTGGTRPTVSCGGTAGTVTIGSTNNKGTFTTPASAQTGCTLTFNPSILFPQAPTCGCTDHNGAAAPIACSTGTESTASVPFTFTSVTSYKFEYHCF